MGDTWVPGLQDKWQYLMENSLELLLFFGPDGCVIEGNKKAKQELGYEESIKGVSISKIFQKFHKLLCLFLEYLLLLMLNILS